MSDRRNRDHFLFTKAFSGIADSELTPGLVKIKYTGQAIAAVGMASFIISWALPSSAPSDTYFEQFGLLGIIVGFALFGVIALYASGRRSDSTKPQNTIIRSLLRVILYIYVPAILITAALIILSIVLIPENKEFFLGGN